MKKRIISILLVLAMVLLMIPTTVFAANNYAPALSVSAERTGSTIIATVKAAPYSGCMTANVKLKFPSDKLTAEEKDIECSGVLLGATKNVESTASGMTISAVWADSVARESETEETILKVTFSVREGVTGAIPFEITHYSFSDGDEGETTALPEGSSGTTTLSIPITDPNAITATVAAPVKGQLLATTAEVADDAPYTVATENHSFLWFEGKGTEGTPVTGSAKPSQVYTVRLTLVAKEGESFDVASLNGKTNTAGWTIVTSGAPTANELWLVKIFQETEKAAKLGGTVMISGQAMFGYTLTANTAALDYDGEGQGTLTYQWKRDGVAIEGATDRSYRLVQEDIGHNISVEVWNSNNTGSVTSTSAVFVQKALNGENPDAPSVGFDGLGQTSITVTYDHEGDYEFACVEWTDDYQAGDISGAVWQDSKTFTGLKPNTPYYIYVRVKATATHEASTAAYTTANTARYEVANDADLKAKLDASVSALNREYNYGWDYPIEVVDQRLPAGWSYSYSTDGGNFSTSKPATIRDVSSSGKYYVKFEHHDYKAYIADFDVKITPKDITPKDGVSIVKARYDEPTYTGSAVTPTNLVLYWNNRVQDVTLTVGEGKDVTIAYSNNVNRPHGTITVTAVEGGNYKGSCNVYFSIQPKTITPTIAAIPAQTYTGGKLTPYFSVRTESGSAMTVGKDYTVSYSNNEDAGTATVTLHPISETEGTSNYTFTDNIYTANFTINKAAFPNSTTASMNVRSNEVKTGVTYQLPTLMNVTGATYGAVTTEGDLIDGTPALGADGRTLTFNTNGKPAGTTGTIKVTITEGKNYEGATFVLTVTAKDKDDADVSITDDTVTGTVTYGRTFTATASAANPGDVAGTWTWESSAPDILEIVSGQGTNKVTVKAVKASPTGATLTAKYSSETHEDTATTNAYTVAQQPIAVAYIDLNDREYDGTLEVNPADIDTSGMSIGGKFAGDDVSVIVTGGSYDEKNVGSRMAELELELDGTAKGNYYLPVPTYTVENAKITPRGVTIGGATVASSKEYDGTTDAEITSTSTSYTVVGAVTGDDVGVDATSPKASYESKDVDTNKTVTFSGFSLTGDDAKNYKLTAQPTANADITRRTLTVTGITVADKIYDGGTDAQITNIAYGNIVSGDQVYAKITASFADANAGENKPVTFNVEYLEGKDAGNYELSSSPLPAATATIRTAQLVGAPTFGKVTKAGTKLSEVDYDLSGIKGVNGEAVLVSFGWDDLTPADTTVEANKAYGWKVTTTNPNYEDLTGSTVLYPVSTSYSDQVKKQSEEFEAKKRGELPEDELDFRDVYEDDYFFDAVQWAAENGITGGVGNGRFGPSLDCSRGQTMTFLWRASGEPEPNPISTDLTDVAAGSYYYEAVLWAMQEGVTTGAGAGRFAPDATVTRGQFVTFLYRLAGASSDGVHPFADVPAGSYYEKAIAWAFAEGITRGTSGTTFSPDAPCTRAQIITFLYRYFNR